MRPDIAALCPSSQDPLIATHLMLFQSFTANCCGSKWARRARRADEKGASKEHGSLARQSLVHRRCCFVWRSVRFGEYCCWVLRGAVCILWLVGGESAADVLI